MKKAGRLIGAVGCGGLVILGLAVGRGRLAAAETQPQNLAGSWVINPELSSNLMRDENGENGAVSTEPQQHVHRGGSPDPFGGGGPMGDGGLSKQQQAKSDAAPPPRPSGTGLSALDRLVIAQQPGQVSITDRDGRTRTLKSDGSKVKGEESPDGAAEFRARWEGDGTLRVEVRPAKGRRHVELWVVSNDRKHLYLTIESQNAEGVTSRVIRAYDPMMTGPSAADGIPLSAVPTLPKATPPPASTPPPPGSTASPGSAPPPGAPSSNSPPPPAAFPRTRG
jgi:hypothetical protein